jgi:hypothetical protein
VKPIKEYSYPKVCVGLSETQLKWLNELSKQKNQSRQDIIRELILREIARIAAEGKAT